MELVYLWVEDYKRKKICQIIYAYFCRDGGNPTYEIFENKKHDNLPYFSHKLCFDVKIVSQLHQIPWGHNIAIFQKNSEIENSTFTLKL